MTSLPRILVITNRVPDKAKPYAGWYVEAHAALHRLDGMEVSVVGPPSLSLPAVLRYLGLAWRLVKVLARFRSDLVHAHWVLPSGLLGLMIARLLNRPLLVTSHGSFVMNYGKRALPSRILIRLVLQAADHVIAVGEDHGQRTAAILGNGGGKVSVIPMGVAVPNDLPERAVCRERYGLSRESFVIAYVGNLEDRKGVGILLDACALLAQSGLPFDLRVAGQGKQGPGLRALARTIGLDEHSVFLGALPHEEVNSLYQSADVIAVPSLREPFGLVALEAMANGRAVVASNVGGLRETIVDEESGLLVPPGDSQALASALKRLSADSALREALGRNAKQAAAKYDIRIQAQKVARLYLDLAKTPDGASA